MAGTRAVVLVVDDDESMRRLIAGALRVHLGVDVVELGDAAMALQRLAALRPRVVLTDLEMPGVDGYEFVRRLRADADGVRIGVVAVSGSAGGDEALAAGCDAFVAKPFRTAHLADTVRRWLADHRSPAESTDAADRPAQ